MGFEKRKEKNYIDERLLIRGSFIPSRLSFFLSFFVFFCKGILLFLNEIARIYLSYSSYMSWLLI
jgi:hypothetical protein